MEELKKKVLALTPDKAFYVYCGIPALLLIMFLFLGQLSFSLGDFGSVSSSGLQLITGKATGSGMGGKSSTESIETGFAGIMAILFVISIIGVAVYGYMKKAGNFIFTIIPVAILFLIAVVGITQDAGFFKVKMSGTFMAWLEILIGLAWVGFAYLRGNAPIEMKK